MKKLISLLLVLAMVAALVACGPKTETPPSGTPTPAGDTPPAGGNDAQSPAPPTSSFVPDTGEPKYGGTLRAVTTADGSGQIGLPWDTNAGDIYLAFPMMEGLFREVPGSGEILPCLAESWEIDMENPAIIVHLRKGVKYHDGSDFNAVTAKWGLDTTKELAQAGSMADYSEITILGDYDISIKIPAYTNSTLSNFTGMMYTFISKEAYEKYGSDYMAEHPIGTGPFKFVEYVKGAYVKFERNNDYWEAGKPYLDGLEIQLIRDTMTQNIALQATGDQSIDMLGSQSGDQVKMFTDLGYQLMLTSPVSLTLMPNMDDESAPWYKKEVREAMSYAIDRQALVDARGFGIWSVATQLSAKGYGGYSDDPNFGVPNSYDPAKAKELLAQAGYPNGFKTTLYGQPSAADHDAVVAIQAMLGAIGITATVEFPDEGGFNALWVDGWDGILVERVLNMTHNETCFWLLFGTLINFFHSFPHSQELDDLISVAQLKLGDNEKELQAIQSHVLDNFYLIPMWYSYDANIIKPNVHGYGADTGYTLYQDIWFE
ncbi:MAG: ABC transporter substrate-binding protein [Oscillospiraceae bacterium]|jgi:peptide/nickel transport system substrate-binding protein|nr:ABC transporter substrate-binding protein [Oscillospiraceae bacterium]